MTLFQSIEIVALEFRKDLSKAVTVSDVKNLKVFYLGKKGKVRTLMQSLKNLSAVDRSSFGQKVNLLKDEIQNSLDSTLEQFEQRDLVQKIEDDWIDVSLPGRRPLQGGEHMVLNLLETALDIFADMGFAVRYGPDIESDFYNFEALNFSKDHPARESHDSFYISDNFLLRTHTTNTQIHVMESSSPPIRVVSPGKCYRNENISARSHVIFHQIDGMYVDKDTTFLDLLSTLKVFFIRMFGEEIKLRYRPSYFPFVEPGVEVDITCLVCKEKGCSVCKHSGWLEVVGAGMVHPNVLKAGGLDPEEYSGYAWGFGVERLVMLKYNISDIRLFLENDLRFLRQF